VIRVESVKARPKKRALYRGGKTTSALKPWLFEDPPMSGSTWYRQKAKKEQGK
jgi:hypothetical protein